jgi:8-oxo-dGTP pyrophosphatase MutT (NUDIX family)
MRKSVFRSGSNMKAAAISLEQAKRDKLFYFVANVVVYRESDGRCLILKRDMREKVHPGKWAVPGGKLEWNDLDVEHPTRMNGDVIDFEHAVEDLLRREAREEAGVALKDRFEYINSVAFVRPDGIPVVLIKLAALYAGGDIALEHGSFTDYAWVTADEIAAYDCIRGIPEEVERTTALFAS